jgi:hypothetical protein
MDMDRVTTTQVASPHQPVEQRTPRLNFSDPAQRAEHIRAFLSWLPSALHEAPGIQWDQLDSSIMGYLIRSVADDPDEIPIAFAIGCAIHAMKQKTLYAQCIHLTNLLRQLRADYGMTSLADLKSRNIWDRLVGGRTLTSHDLHRLGMYEAFSSIHERAYFEGLTVRQQTFWEAYALPQLPAYFVARYGQRNAIHAASAQRRKEQSDVLVPLFPLLVEIAQLRKQAAERLIQAFRTHRERARAGAIALPYQFEYRDLVFEVTEDAPTLAQMSLVERDVTLSFTLWNRTSWVKAHLEHYGHESRRQWKRQILAYAPEHNTYFLQYEGPLKDLLWCGELIANQHLGKRLRSAAKRLGSGVDREHFTRFEISRSGLLSPDHSDTQWLLNAMRGEAVLFEPESLYRGILYGAALATLALTNGSRVSELLQVSATRFETIAVDEVRNQQPTGRKIGILVQNLLPKGYRKESERQFFLIGERAGRLLTEIGQLLESTHGGAIPIVQPYDSKKSEDLYPEPYLFQWAAGPDGRLGLLKSGEVGALLRFLFHGLILTTRTGKPIRVAPHLLRHVLATHARTVKQVPAEAIAYLLHHRVMLPDSTRSLSISEATAYYSRMTVEQVLALLFDAQSTLASQTTRSYLPAPPLRTLEQMEEALRKVFEHWSLIGPTALGYCSAGLCVRPDNRALCLGCRFLVPHYSNLPKVKTWRQLYVLQAELHEAHGHERDAQQARQMIQYLDDVAALMQIQIRARQDGGYLPFADTLPPSQKDEGDLT